MVVPLDRSDVYKTVFFTMESNYFVFPFSTPLVSFRVARIWLFVVVPVSRERCRNLQNRIFIFDRKTQGRPKSPFHFVETICNFLFSFFHPSQLFFVLFFSCFNPSRLFFVFLFSVVLQKCSPLCLAKKMLLSIIKPMVSSIVFSVGPERCS